MRSEELALPSRTDAAFKILSEEKNSALSFRDMDYELKGPVEWV
jgi:hypothetical protein